MQSLLEDIPISLVESDLPAEALALCRAAEQRAIDFVERRAREERIPEFQASNVRVAYRVLRELLERDLVPTLSFCEWGSGLGGVTCAAAMLGFEACGVEIEADLVAEARLLARDFELPAKFHAGSFKPDGAYRGELDMGEVRQHLGLDPASFAVVYAYSWPAEEPMTLELFSYGALAGSLLVTYHGGGRIRVRRKTREFGPG